MTTRISDLQRTGRFVENIYYQRLALERAREEVATGLEVINPSDDPGRAGTISQLQSTSQRLGRHKDRVSSAIGYLANQESILDSAEEVLVRARELAAQGANGTISIEAREQMAEEVFALRDQMVALGNSTYQGRYLYGGLADDTEPFAIATPPPGYTNPTIPPATAGDSETERYVFTAADGATNTREMQITDTETIRLNTVGNEVFTNSIGALERLGRALKGYRTTLDVNNLPDGGGTAYALPAERDEQTANILSAMDALNSAMVNDIQPEKSDLGARMNRLQQVTGVLESMIVNTEMARSTLQDADPAEAIANITSLETGLKALLSSGARISSLSLMDYI